MASVLQYSDSVLLCVNDKLISNQVIGLLRVSRYLRVKDVSLVEMMAVVWTSDWHHLPCPVASRSICSALDLLNVTHTLLSHVKDD